MARSAHAPTLRIRAAASIAVKTLTCPSSDGSDAENRRPSPRARFPGPGEPIIDTAISTIVQGRLYYRGQDAAELSAQATLEDAAGLLWEMASPPSFPPGARDHAPRNTGRSYAYVALAKAPAGGSPTFGRAANVLQSEAASLVGCLASAFGAVSGTDAPLHLRLAAAWQRDEAGGEVIPASAGASRGPGADGTLGLRRGGDSLDRGIPGLVRSVRLGNALWPAPRRRSGTRCGPCLTRSNEPAPMRRSLATWRPVCPCPGSGTVSTLPRAIRARRPFSRLLMRLPVSGR